MRARPASSISTKGPSVVQGGQPAFGVDRTGNCWFVADGQLVIDPEQMFGAMSSMRDQAMAGMDPQQRAMMDQMMAMRKPAHAACGEQHRQPDDCRLQRTVQCDR